MQFNWFKYTTIGVVLLFCSILVFVIYTANTRAYTGRTGMDAAKIQAMRIEASKQFEEQRKQEP